MRRASCGLAMVGACALGAAAFIAIPSSALADESGIRINEVESKDGAPGDWIEFVNPTGAAISLAGFTVKDAVDSHSYVFPEGTVVEPGALVVIDEVVDGVGDFDFGLGDTDSVRLFDSADVLVEERSWTAHAATTWGLAGDGSWALTQEPTKDAANVFPAPEEPGVGDAEPTADPTVVVNEIIYDEISRYTDRVELYNAGDASVDLTGWHISDDKRDTFGYVPAGTVLAPGGFVVLVSDVDFTFGLGKGDEVVLYDPTDVVVDSYAYANTAPLAVWARCPDGTGQWAHATQATPGTANVCEAAPVPGAILINEVDSQPADWIEFYNLGTEPLDISGYEIRDNSDDHRWQFPAGATIAGGALLVVDANAVGVVGGAQKPFGDAIGIGSADRIRLFDRAGALLDDTSPWEGHAAIDGDAAAATLARCPDGVGDFLLAYATPGASNECVMPDVAINEVESNGDATDWAEIVNTGATAVDISGWTLVDNDPVGHAADTTPLPAGATLEPGAFFVFEQNVDFGFGLGGGDTVTIRDASGNTVAEYAYADHAAGVWGRCPDGTGDFLDLAVSTKGLRNACGNPVRLNEVESDAGSPDDWIELVNPTGSALDVSGIVVKDDDDAHAYTVPEGTSISAAGYLVIERAELGFGLGGGDKVRLFDGALLIDETTWGEGHAATTWGRCRDTEGPFAATSAATKGAANECPGEIPIGVWPGSPDVHVIDPTPTFLEDSSGLDTQQTAEGTILWGVDNGTGIFWKLAVAADGTATPVAGWEDGRRARFQKDAANPTANGPDSEGITVDGAGWIYLASERDNSNKGVNQNIVLKIDPNAPGPDVVATQEWNVTSLLPAVGANLGIEAVEWVADSALIGKLVDANTNQTYQPADYPGHGDGLFFVAVEDTGDVYGFALGSDGSAVLVATIDPGLAGVMALDYDTVLGVMWAVCDDGCEGRAAQIELNGTANPGIAHVARPAGMPNINNEGFATAPAALVAEGKRPAWWFADGFAEGALRYGSLDAGPSNPPNPTDPTDPTGPTGPTGPTDPIGTTGPGLPGTGAPLPGSELDESNAGDVIAPATARPGQAVTVGVGSQLAGDSVEVWFYSSPVRIGAGAVTASGTITATIPADATPGEHRIAVYDAEGALIGWTGITIVAADSLAMTGGGGADGALIVALGMLIAGAAVFVLRRRTRSV